MVLELVFQRASVHPVHDAKRLEDGKDLNDALLDFFVKLGQALIPPGGESGRPVTPSVAYLGSHFYDVLRKGGPKNGREGHKNVANWAKRRLGKNGFDANSIGAFAVPVNEVLVNSSYNGGKRVTADEEKHWWLALILNPKAGGAATLGSEEEQDVSMLCLDSFVRADTRYMPPVRAVKKGGTDQAYSVEVTGLSRVGFNMRVLLRAQGDGSSGAIAEPRRSRLRAGGREFPNAELDMRHCDRGADGIPGRLDGALGFRLDRRGAAKTGGEYVLDFGEAGEDYQPPLKLRMGQKPTEFQAEVAAFLGGYLAKERDGPGQTNGVQGARVDGASLAQLMAQAPPPTTRVEACTLLPGVPQQETSHDCGFFILEMILRALQLPAESLRELATASSVEIAMLPWPSQKQVLRRKAMLRDALDALLSKAQQTGTGDVEALMRADESLRTKVRGSLIEGAPSFPKGFDRWAAGDWDLSPSPSRSRDGSEDSAGGRKRRGGQRKRKRAGNDDDGRRRRRRRRDTSSSEAEEEEDDDRSRSKSKDQGGAQAQGEPGGAPEPEKPKGPTTFTMVQLEAMKPGALRALCMEFGVLPTGLVEKQDLIRALAPLASADPKAAYTPGRAVASVPKGPPFEQKELDAAATKVLKRLCTDHGVLPDPPIERTDLVKALAAIGKLT